MLKVNNIKKSFDDYMVLRGVSLSIADGEIYGLIGKNGAGKTTLMNIVAGLSKADDGDCTMDQSQGVFDKVGYLPDIPAFFDYLTTREYLDFLFMDSGKNSKRNDLLQLVGLKGNEKIKSMSRGMKQRLGVAAALVNNPSILLLDEPTSALDPQGRHELMEVLKQLKQEGHSIMLSTHILADMEKVCDKVGFLQDGIIKKEVKIDEVLAGDQNLWNVMFENEVSLPSYDKSKIEVTLKNGNEYLFEIRDQKYALQYLAQIPVKISHIRNQIFSLDDLFEEVCK